MPTIGTKPSLEATQAVGAILLHQFARERFVEAGLDEGLIREAENRVHLDELAETLLNEETSDLSDSMTSNSMEVINCSNDDVSLESGTNITTTTITNNPAECGMSLNGSTMMSCDGNYHSMNETINQEQSTVLQDRTLYHSMNASNQSVSAFDRLQTSPSLASYGKELRRIADEFEKSRLRQTVKDRAGKVNLSDITKESFVKLLEELFQEKVTREKIVILFFFCTDVALRAAMFAQDLVIKLLGWSFSYIINRVCSLVHKLGGWDRVLFYQLPSILITCFAALAICSLVVYLKKNLLRAY